MTTSSRPADEFSPFGTGPAFGDGPAYPIIPEIDPGGDGVLHYGTAGRKGPWYGVKVFWFSGPDYPGPVLVRGRRLDGRVPLRFLADDQVLRELRLPSYETPDGWRGYPSTTLLRARGCYGYQIDGLTFSRVVVFAAAP